MTDTTLRALVGLYMLVIELKLTTTYRLQTEDAVRRPIF